MSTKPAAYHKRKEIIILIVSIVLLVSGVVIDSLGISLVEIEASSFNGICTTMVSVQATVSVVIFSLVSIFSSFQTTEKYGISVVRYLIKYRNKTLNQSNIFLIEMCLLLVSVVCLFFGWVNTIFCILATSVFLVLWLAKESFLLYRVEDIDEEMFSFLEYNLHDKKLGLLAKYITSERIRLQTNYYRCIKPESRLDELWINEIECYKSSLDSDEFKAEHELFVSLANDYLANEDYSVQSYGLDIALSVIKKYSELKKIESTVNQYNTVIDDVPVKYAKQAFGEWMLALATIAYSDNPERNKVRSIVSLIDSLEVYLGKYERHTTTNHFIHVLIQIANSDQSRMTSLSNMLYGLKGSLYSFYNESEREKYVGFAIHFYLLTIYSGYVQMVGKEFKSHGYNWEPETKEEKLLFGIIVCYLYYMSYRTEDDEIEKLFYGKIKKQNIIDILKENSDAIRDFFVNLELSSEYLREMKKYMTDYEILIPDNGAKYMIIDSVIDEGMVLMKAMSSFIDDSWLGELILNDWYHFYMMIVGNERTRKQFMELKWLAYHSEDYVNDTYSELEEKVINLSYSAVLDKPKTIKEEDEKKLESFIREGLEEFPKEYSFGFVSEEEDEKELCCLLLRDLSSFEHMHWDYYLKSIKKRILFNLCIKLSQKLKCQILSSLSDVESFLETVNEFDYRIGNPGIPLYDRAFTLRGRVQETLPSGYCIPFYKENSVALIAAHKNRIGIGINIHNVEVRKLTDEEKVREGKRENNKYKDQIMNDIYFDFTEEEHFKFMDNEYRVLQVDYSISVSAEEDSGICYIFSKPARKSK
ncbi:MAG: hypothetical protein ACI4SL_10700 [Candidatus Ornithospirochaeta sp.]